MNDAPRDLAREEIESLQDFLGDRRIAQQLHQDEADREAARIAELEEELADLQQSEEPR